MSSRPLNLAIVWHMHQPFYQDLVSGEYVLPWVRLHAAKDYYDMLAIVEKFPKVKLNFNLVPSLLLQIEDYLADRGSDKFLILSLKDPKDLTLEEKAFILQNFFMANWENMIKPYRRYHDLLMKRGRFVLPTELSQIARRFSSQEIMDLQVWFNLSWFGFIYKNDDPVIAGMLAKGKNFSQEDKKAVLDKQREIMGKIIPTYRRLQESGQIEISTSPFYHPILPLLCDTNVAKEAMPYANLPMPFRYPEDAQAQIKMAIEYHTKCFGRPPVGMWPSEGSVSEQIIPILARQGIKWIATDEGILERSLQKVESRHRTLSAEDLYQPYVIEIDGGQTAMIFRNHFISDQVGFVYYRWKIGDAVNDFMQHVQNIRMSLPENGKEYLLTVILDGENAWEYYAGGGKDFLEAFYGRLNDDPAVRTVKVGEYIEQNPPRKRLTRLFAGSWISNNFKIWIGHEEDNTAWDCVRQARLALDGTSPESNPLAWQELYIAEGSDWCWWYGDDHSSDNDSAFDELFRRHLQNIYHLIGRVPPAYLHLPIKKLRTVRPLKEPVYLLNPSLDGRVTNYYEWLSAGHFDISKARGAMHQIETVIKDVYYGFSLTDLFVRIDFNIDPQPEVLQLLTYNLNFYGAQQTTARVIFDQEKSEFVFTFKAGEGYAPKKMASFAMGKIIEASVSFADLQAKAGDKIEFTVSISKDKQELERWPREGVITVFVPNENYAQEQWSV